MTINLKNMTKLLDSFDFENLFIEELGWDYCDDDSPLSITVNEQVFTLNPIANKRKLMVYLCTLENQSIPTVSILKKIDLEVTKYSSEHFIIYTSEVDKKQVWQWVKKESNKKINRTINYSPRKKKALLEALENITFDIEEEKDVNLIDVKERTKKAFDIEKVTKQFFAEFQLEHRQFVGFIQGIDDQKEVLWYASVILNRLMFVYFLQKKGFLDNNNKDYLQDKLKASKEKGKNLYYQEFLLTLFFEGFGKQEYLRSEETSLLIGKIKYLNGGLFLPHKIEEKYQGKIKIKDQAFTEIFTLFSRYRWHLDDTPTGNDNEINPDVLGYIFEKYINQKQFGAYYTRPEITEYLCDKTINKSIVNQINQKAKTDFKTVNELILNLDNKQCELLINDVLPNLSILDPACGSGAFLIAAMKTLINIYTNVINNINSSENEQLKEQLEKIKNSHPSLEYYIKKRIITDNLYGVDIMEEATEIAKLRLFLSLVASAETIEDLEPLPNVDFNIMAGNSLIGLINVDGGAFDEVNPPNPPLKGGNSPNPALKGGSINYGIEPTQKHLFEPTLIQGNLLNQLAASEYESILKEKNASIKKYKEHAFKSEQIEGTEQESRLQMLRNHIEKVNRESMVKLNQLLLDEFSTKLGIKYEEKQLKGKGKKRVLNIKDVDTLKPFHWGYHFDEIIKKGGFDIVLGNPPWETFKPQAKEFFANYSDLVTKNKMDIKTFQKQQKKLLENPEIASAWLEYQSKFPYVSLYFRNALQYHNQISVVNGRKQGTDINLYKLFVEQCVNLLAKNGECGIVIPSGIYTDLGTKQLREMLFSQTNITGLFCFENRKNIFEGVDSRFKFVVLTFENDPPQPPLLRGENTKEVPFERREDTKEVPFERMEDTKEVPFERREDTKEVPLTKGDLGGYITQSFPAKFMRHEVTELKDFPDEDTIYIDVDLIKRLSPDSLSVMEFKSDLDITIAKKMSRFPLLGEEIEGKWNLKLTREFDMTNDSKLFKTEAGAGRLPLYEGKMIHQFTHQFASPRYWIDEAEGRAKVLKRNQEDKGQKLDYQCYRLGFRDVARNTDIRTMIATVIHDNLFCGNTLIISKQFDNLKELLFISGLLNSFISDFIIRQRVTAHCNMFYIYQTPVPRLTEGDRYFAEIVERAGKLICVTPEFDELAEEIGLIPLNSSSEAKNENSLKSGENTEKVPLTKGDLGGSQYGITDKQERMKLRAEIDAMVAQLYGINEVEFKHILSTFPIVSEEIKELTLKVFQDSVLHFAQNPL